MNAEHQEELSYLREALQVLKSSLEREQNPAAQNHLREYIRDLERRIAETQNKA